MENRPPLLPFTQQTAEQKHDDSGQWHRSYGNELWEFADNGLMQRRIASINDKPIKASEREFS